MKVGIGKAAEELRISIPTLRGWEKSGKIKSERTPKGHRRYDLARLLGIGHKKRSSSKKTLVYARMSSKDL